MTPRAAFRSRRLRGTVFVAPAVWCIAALSVAAQTLPGAAPGTGPAAVPGTPQGVAPEEVTEELVLRLREDGLIARQAEISEGLLLMDRQLRQAQMAQEILSVFGAQTPVEVAPGTFRDFSGTPLGMRERLAQMQLEIDLIETTAALQAAREESAGAAAVAGGFFPPRAVVQDDAATAEPVVETAPVPALLAGQAAEIVVRQLHGGAGRYAALLRIDDSDVLVAPGDRLDSGVEILAVQPGQVVIRVPGTGLRSLPTPE